MAEEKKGLSFKGILLAFLLLLAAAGGVAWKVPLLPCLPCEGKGKISLWVTSKDCPDCGGSGKVTVVHRLRWAQVIR